MKMRFWVSLFLLISASIFAQAQDVLMPDANQLTPLVVAKEHILRGTPITQEMLTTIYINADDFDSTWVSDADMLIGRYINGDALPYQPIHNTYIVATNPVIGACTLPANRSYPATIPINQMLPVRELDAPIHYGLRATLLIEAAVTGVAESILIPVVDDVEFLCRTPDDSWVVTMASNETRIYIMQLADAGAIFHVAPLVPINIQGE